MLPPISAEQKTPMKQNASALAPFLDEEKRLTAFPAKQRKKLPALWYLAEKIEPDRRYTEAQINDLLDDWAVFHDHSTLRRELYNKRLLGREADGSVYWKESPFESFEAFAARWL